jgi:hypothetical protein
MQASQYHVFNLPPSILDKLTPRDRLFLKPSRSSSPTPAAAPPVSHGGTRACNVCLAATFDDVEEQRVHFRSDWHRYNVKVRFKGGSPVTEPDFAELVDGKRAYFLFVSVRSVYRKELQDSISGSASSEDDDSNDSDAVATLVRRANITARTPSPTANSSTVPRSALAWFHSPPSIQIGVYRALFSTHNDPTSYLSELKALQKSGERKWALFMTAGGHFAGAVVRVSRAEESVQDDRIRKKPKQPKPDIEVLRHKTFHRYTSQYYSLLIHAFLCSTMQSSQEAGRFAVC